MGKRGRKTNLNKAQDLKTLKQQQKQAAHFFKPVSETTRAARTPPPGIIALKEISPNVNRTISIKPSPIKVR